MFLLVTLPDIHRFYFFLTDRLNNKPFLNLVIKNNPTAPLKYIYTTLQFIVSRLFSDVNVSRGMWKQMQGVVGFLMTGLLQIYQGIFQ